MPIYEYECTSCQKRFELQQKMTDPSIQTCDQLGCAEAKPVNKVISAPAIMFKGTGWYVTDYSDKLKDPEAKPENKGEKTEVGNSTNSSDSKGTAESKPSSDSSTSKNESGSSTAQSSTSSPSASSSSSSSSAESGTPSSTPSASKSEK